MKSNWILILTVASEALAERRIVVSIPDRKAALVAEDGSVVKVYPVAVGARRSPSPTGEFEIVNRIPKPTYYAPGVVIGPGKANPLGTRWIGLSRKGYGIHGTNAPGSIGRRASHGCIRMRNRDVEELFEMVRVGDRVVIE
jgi:lipoprotein-anchoring transpeptidase ErfK/SrfK